MRSISRAEIQFISGGAAPAPQASSSPFLSLLKLPFALIGGVFGLALLLDMLKDTGGRA